MFTLWDELPHVDHPKTETNPSVLSPPLLALTIACVDKGFSRAQMWTLPTPRTSLTAGGSLRAQISPSHSSLAHRGRTGVSLLAPLVAVGRCWLRLAAGIWGVEIPLLYFHGSPRIPDICAVNTERERGGERNTE
ncbi:hypothetical protein PBY51_021877 [Eleginops maclovinus]|uniref:Uncharacterized protein n=1 Tax=Eleginops maclovinus TaxID=56733 RepID=A0AAN8AF30_ELEMC|nr:hypothetical protein PBY51_021877 [Eleginops maclovinus]